MARPSPLSLLVVLLVLVAPAVRAESPHLVADLATGGTSSSPTSLTAIDGQVLFLASDASGGSGLWRTDGTAAGTSFLMNVAPPISYDISSVGLTVVGSSWFFLTGTPPSPIELWKSDGTLAGTVRVATTPGAFEGAAKTIGAVGTTFYFMVSDPAGGRELWASDGSEAGTLALTDFAPGDGVDLFTRHAAVGDTIFFTAATAATGMELWRSDGTPGGTTIVVDLDPGAAHGSPGGLVAIDDVLYFAANEPVGGRELWKTDGTEAGTERVIDLVPGPGGSQAGVYAKLGNDVFFQANDGTSYGMWKSDGTALGTAHLGTSQFPEDFCESNGLLYWDGAGDGGRELWRSDGTPAGTFRIDIRPGANGSNLANIAPLSDGVLFGAFPSLEIRQELWKSNGTPGGTVQVLDINPNGDSSPGFFAALGIDDYVFSATGSNGERELWRTNGTAAGTAQVIDLGPSGSASSSLSTLAPFGDELAFVRNGNEIWVSDGTASGTEGVSGSGEGTTIASLGNTLYFAGDQGLWKRTASNVTQLHTGALYELTAANGALYYSANFHAFRSTGAAAGVELASVAGPTTCGLLFCHTFPSHPRSFTAVGSRVFFMALGVSAGFELWATDGTPAGTTQLAVLGVPNSDDVLLGPYPQMVPVNGTLYFQARPSDSGDTTGLELWKSDGTVAGTGRVADINPGGDSDPTDLVDFGGVLVFAADDGSGGRELWKSDGTALGTVRIADIDPGPAGSDPTDIIVHDGRLFFAATAPTGGRELMTSDGTGPGTVAVADVNPGSAGSDPAELVSAGGFVFFSAFDDASGRELWSSDGTPTGTTRVEINPGLSSANPGHITAVDDRLFFTAFTFGNGTELWTMSTSAPPCGLALSAGIPGCEVSDPDSDGDGICDAADPCTNPAALTIIKSKLKISKLGGDPADEMITIQGQLTVPTMPSLDLLTNGFRIRVAGASGAAIVDASFAPGPYDTDTGTGWKVKSAGTKWSYACDKSVVKLGVTHKPAGSGSLRFKVTAKERSLAVPASELPLTVTVVVDAPTAETNQCAERAFDTAACASKGGTSVVCR